MTDKEGPHCSGQRLSRPGGVSLPPSRARRWALLLLATVAVTLAACGSPRSPAITTSTPSAAAARRTISANWVTFFAGSTPASGKVALLENGKSFAPIIDAQSSSPLARSVAATVSKVTITSSRRAIVRYSLEIGGQPALADQEGEAVLQEGTWKVGVTSFCALLALERVHAAACPATETTTT